MPSATKVLTLRMEGDVYREVCVFKALHRIDSTSEAIRALVEIALRDTQQLDAAFRRAAWRTGVKDGANKLREKLDKAVAEALGVADGST